MKHLLVLLALTMTAWTPWAANAQPTEYSIDSFHADMAIHERGTLYVRETIQGEFFVEKHGIIRDIPFRYHRDEDTDVVYDVRVNRVVDEEGNDVPHEVTKGFQAVSVKIGSPYITVTGPYTYVIEYEVGAPFLYFDDHDELFWNVTGTDWDVPIETASATIRLPEGAKGLDSTCYTGSYGSEEQDCTSSVDKNGFLQFSGTGPLTIVAGFTPDVIQEIQPEIIDLKAQREASEAAYLAYQEYRRERERQAWWFILVPIITSLLAFLGWVAWGKEAKPSPTIIAQYEPPKHLRPAELGALLDGVVHAQDLSASIIDLAVRGYLKITETKEGKTFTLDRLPKNDSNLHPWEKKLLTACFGTSTSIASSSLAFRLGSTQHSLRLSILKKLKADGYYRTAIGTNKLLYYALGLLLACASIPLGDFAFDELNTGIPFTFFLLSGIPFLLLAPFMNAKTAKGVDALAHAQGFRLFLKTAEKYRIHWQEKEGIFEEYLPYAMAFGVADKWSRALADLYKERGENMPATNWYTGTNNAIFQPDQLVGKMRAFSKASSPRLPSSGGSSSYRGPSSSGFSSRSSGGGGFSGGGFGGGGGRSW